MPRNNTSSSKTRSDGIVTDYISDLRVKDVPDNVHVARITKNLGNARIQVVYGKENKVFVNQAKIPGRFTGRAKKTMMASPGAFVLIAETGVNGALALEMIALISREELNKIKDLIEIHPNILSVETDAETLTTKIVSGGLHDEIEFDGVDEDDEEEPDIDAI